MGFISQIKLNTTTYDVSAIKLKNARTINGTTFDGTANITTANWGTARNIKIGNTSKSINGAANATWTFNEMGVLPLTAGNSYPLTGVLWIKSPWPGNIVGANSAGKLRYQLFSNSNTGAVADTILATYTDEEGTARQVFRFKTNGEFHAPQLRTPTIVLDRSSTIANNYPAQILFRNNQTDNNIATQTAAIKVYDDGDANTYGQNMVIGSGGNMVIGSGESAQTTYNNILKTNTGENMYVTSDGNIYLYTNCNTWANRKTGCYVSTAGVLYGAAWNDYAEFRHAIENYAPGVVVVETPQGLTQSTKRLSPGAAVVSDTFGFAIGETEEAKCPIAVSGRVLAHTDKDRNKFKPGDAVCSGRGGTVSKMNRLECILFPDRILGIVSEIPDYDTWGTGDVPVDGRIWIKVR